MDKQRAGHTPGPWTILEGFISARFSDGEVYDICDPRCAPATPDLVGEMEANADLIAAAPDLLAALEGMREELRNYSYRQHLADWVDRADAAIAKARGRA